MSTTQSAKTVSIIILALALSVGFAAVAHADTLYRELELGMTGPDVVALQTFLAADPSIYPQGLITGYFGYLTKAAVARFQAQNGIATVGRVGPITLASINRMMGAIGGSDDVHAPIISNIAVGAFSTSSLISWATNEETQGVLYYSALPIYMAENQGTYTASVLVTGVPLVSANSTLRLAHAVNVPNLQASTTYYYVIHATDQAGNVSVTWPATFVTKK